MPDNIVQYLHAGNSGSIIAAYAALIFIIIVMFVKPSDDDHDGHSF